MLLLIGFAIFLLSLIFLGLGFATKKAKSIDDFWLLFLKRDKVGLAYFFFNIISFVFILLSVILNIGD